MSNGYLGGGGFDPSSYMLKKLLEELFEDKSPEYRQRTSDMNNIVKLANTEAGLDSALAAFKQFDKDNDNWDAQLNEAGDIIGANLNAKRNEFSKYKTALKQAQTYYDSGILDSEKILSYDIDDFEDLSKEVRKIGELSDIISSGGQRFNYSISGGQSNEMLSRDLLSRTKKINGTLKGLALTGKIPEELVELVIMGEPIAPVINQKRSSIKSQILKNQSRLDFAKKIIARSDEAGGQPVPVEHPSLQGVTYKDAEGESKPVDFLSLYNQVEGKSSTYDIETVSKWIEDFSQTHNQLNNEFLKWSRSKYTSDIDLDNLIDNWNPESSNSSSSSNKNNNNVNAYGNQASNEFIGSDLNDVGSLEYKTRKASEKEWGMQIAEDFEDDKQIPDEPVEEISNEGITSSDWKGTAAALTAFGAYSQKDKIEKGFSIAKKNLSKAARYMHSFGKLSAPQITEFLETPSVQNTLDNLKKTENQLKTLQPGTKEYVEKLTRKKNIIKNRSEYWANKFNVDKKHINKLWSTKEKWDIFKFKSDLKNKYPKVAKDIFTGKYTPKTASVVKGVGKMGRTYLPYKVGSIVSDALGVEGMMSVPTTLAAGYGTEKGFKFAANKIKQMASSPKGRKFIMNQFKDKMGRRIIQGAMKPGHPFMRLFAGALGASVGGKELYDAIMNYEEE